MENPKLTMNYFFNSLNKGEQITFLSFRLFSIRKGKKVICSNEFDTKNADLYINKEVEFVETLMSNNINFKYLKLIPDDVVEYILDAKLDQQILFSYQDKLSKYYSTRIPKATVMSMSQLLKSTKLNNYYDRVFNRVYKKLETDNASNLVDDKELLNETTLRSTYYSIEPLPPEISMQLAKRAFALFAAESSVIYKISQTSEFKNIIVIAGKKSINTYKYDFFRLPKGRPILPKLFVL